MDMDTPSFLATLSFGMILSVTIIRIQIDNMPEGLRKDVSEAVAKRYVLGGYILAFILMLVALVMRFSV